MTSYVGEGVHSSEGIRPQEQEFGEVRGRGYPELQDVEKPECECKSHTGENTKDQEKNNLPFGEGSKWRERK